MNHDLSDFYRHVEVINYVDLQSQEIIRSCNVVVV